MVQKKISSARPGRGAGTRPVAAALPSDASAPNSDRLRLAEDAGRILEIFVRLRDATPEPKTELLYADPFTLLVAVALSAQATDVSVNKAAAPLFEVAGTPEAMLALGEERLKAFIRTIGLYNSKARNVMALCDLLVRQHGGVVPRERTLLEALPGVGRKTANVVLNTIWHEPVIAVDTHVFRVANRIPLAVGATPLAVELGLEAVVPAEFKRHAHHWLILHGRYTCTARKPACATWVIVDLCSWPDKTA